MTNSKLESLPTSAVKRENYIFSLNDTVALSLKNTGIKMNL